MINKRILLSVLIICCVGVVAGTGTWATFSDTKASTANTFTSGSLTMAIANDGGSYGNGVTGTWVSPANFKPGDSFSATLKYTDTGSVDAQHLYFNLLNVKHTDPKAGSSTNLMDKIIITNVQERFGSYTTPNQVDYLAAQVGQNGVLTLAQFCNNAYYTWNPTSGLPVIANGDKKDYDFILGFKFADDADNTFQGDTCSFDLQTQATQFSPTAGYIALHQ